MRFVMKNTIDKLLDNELVKEMLNDNNAVTEYFFGSFKNVAR